MKIHNILHVIKSTTVAEINWLVGQFYFYNFDQNGPPNPANQSKLEANTKPAEKRGKSCANK